MLGGSNVAVIGQSALFKQTKLDPDSSDLWGVTYADVKSLLCSRRVISDGRPRAEVLS